jgi:hypothetical protein
MIIDPYQLDPLAIGQDLTPEDFFLEPPLGSDRWFRSCYARALALAAGIYSLIPAGRESDPIVARLDRIGTPIVNPVFAKNIVPAAPGFQTNSMPDTREFPDLIPCQKGVGIEDNIVPAPPGFQTNVVPSEVGLEENSREFSALISCQKEARLEDNIVPGGAPPLKKFRGAGVEENITSLQEMTFSGLRELRAEDPVWDVVSGLGPGVGLGNWRAPKLVIVGGEPTDSGEGVYPLYSRAGSWLFHALRTLGWDECDLFFCNSIGPDGKRHRKELRALHDAFAPHDPVWISLGAVADRVTNSLRKSSGGLVCAHPSWHLKIRSKESVRDYARMLLDAGLPTGDSFDIAVHPVSDEDLDREIPFNLGDAFDLPPAIWIKPEAPTPSGSKRRHMTKAKSEVARLAYVTGEATTLKEASKIAKCDYNRLLVVAREEGWRGERERHQDMIRERALSISMEQETKEISKARTTAWSAAVKAVDIVNRRLESGKYVPNAMDAARLVSMAMDLSSASGVGGDHERERVRNRTIAQIGKDLVQTLQSQFGKDVIDVKAVVRSEPDESS